MPDSNSGKELGIVIKQRRQAVALTLEELAQASCVSKSHLGRVERGERFPSARVLSRIAGPLWLTEEEVFALAGYLSPRLTGAEMVGVPAGNGRLGPLVAGMLAQETPEVQRAVVAILSLIKSISGGTV